MRRDFVGFRVKFCIKFSLPFPISHFTRASTHTRAEYAVLFQRRALCPLDQRASRLPTLQTGAAFCLLLLRLVFASWFSLVFLIVSRAHTHTRTTHKHKTQAFGAQKYFRNDRALVCVCVCVSVLCRMPVFVCLLWSFLCFACALACAPRFCCPCYRSPAFLNSILSLSV